MELVPEYGAALLARGRILLAQGKPAEALPPLKLAAARIPLPEYLWVLADAFRAAGEEAEATKVEAQLEQTGARNDARTYSLYLATRRQQLEKALELAKAELQERADLFTHDALAWAHFAAGNLELAQEHSAKAVAEDTNDPRLWLHRGIISAAAAQPVNARTALERASARRQMLLPCESALLDQQLAALEGASASPLTQNAAPAAY
jgi:tetratricopeptide (TPR) repeat protein